MPGVEIRPVPRKGEDLGITARRFADYGDSNAARLVQARENYDLVRERYAHPDAE